MTRGRRRIVEGHALKRGVIAQTEESASGQVVPAASVVARLQDAIRRIGPLRRDEFQAYVTRRLGTEVETHPASGTVVFPTAL